MRLEQFGPAALFDEQLNSYLAYRTSEWIQKDVTIKLALSRELSRSWFWWYFRT
jgi:hypothetical protein